MNFKKINFPFYLTIPPLNLRKLYKKIQRLTIQCIITKLQQLETLLQIQQLKLFIQLTNVHNGKTKLSNSTLVGCFVDMHLLWLEPKEE